MVLNAGKLLGLFEYGKFEKQNVLRADGNSEQ